MAAKRAEKERIDKERFETLKQKEVQRITEERRRNDTGANVNAHTNGVSESSPVAGPIQLQQSASQGVIGTTSHGQDELRQNVQKSNSIVNMLGERLRRGSDAINVKRAESMKIGPKITKRTPSFTTRRRAQSFRKNQQTDQLDLPPVEIQGMLERKHELQSGGKRAPVRAWKSFHTVLCGQLLCFFKDEDDFFEKKAATAPVNILNARCEKADNYTKRKNVFRLHLPDGSEFLFLAANKIELLDWVNKLSFHASLPPNLQLMSYDESIKVTVSCEPHPRKTDQKQIPSTINYYFAANIRFTKSRQRSYRTIANQFAQFIARITTTQFQTRFHWQQHVWRQFQHPANKFLAETEGIA